MAQSETSGEKNLQRALTYLVKFVHGAVLNFEFRFTPLSLTMKQNIQIAFLRTST